MSSPTINLRTEYSLSLQTNSYNEIWSKIHHELSPTSPSPSSILQPNRASIEEALVSAQPSQLTKLVSNYFDSSERTSHLFLSLRRSVDTARTLYSPISTLLDVLPSHSHLSSPQCHSALDTIAHFLLSENPFPAADEESESFSSMRYCFAELKQQLDLRLKFAKKKHRLLRRITSWGAACLVVSVTAVAIVGVVLAAHVLAALAPAVCCCNGSDLFAERRRKLREHMLRVDAAARETYVLNNNLATIERLVARLYANVESDRELVRIGVERARGGGSRGQCHAVEEVLRHLRKNQGSFQHQLGLLDEHICLCLAAVNRSRALLLQQIHY